MTERTPEEVKIARDVILSSGGGLGPKVAYCPRCNGTQAVYPRRVVCAGRAYQEVQDCCGRCLWVLESRIWR